MKGSEWTLMLFTLLAQTAAGLFLALYISNIFSGWKSDVAGGKLLNDKFLFLTCAILAAALIISFFHLGNIKNALYALNNISTSWLSREILFIIIFSALTFADTLASVKGLLSLQALNIVGGLTALSGMTLIFAMSKIYMLENIPAWNSLFTPVSFFSSAIILGAFTFLASFVFLLKRQDGIADFFPVTGLFKVLLVIISVLVIAELLAWFTQVFILSNGERAAAESFNLIIGSNTLLFFARIVVQSIVFVLLLFVYLSFNKGMLHNNFLYLAFLLIFLAELTGRYLFYAMFAGVGV